MRWVVLASLLVVAGCRTDKKADASKGKVPSAAGGAPSAGGLAEDAFDFEVKSWTRSLDAYEMTIEDVGMGTALDSVLEKTGGDLVVNGGFFDKEGKALGLAMSNGLRLSPIAKKMSGGVLTVAGSGTKAELFETESFDPPEGLKFAVQCRPRLVVKGEPNVKSDDGHRSERTALCLRDGGKTIEAYLVKGGEGGPSLFALGKWLASKGCEEALNLDGGPSTGAAWVENGEKKLLAPRGGIRHAIVFKRRGAVRCASDEELHYSAPGCDGAPATSCQKPFDCSHSSVFCGCDGKTFHDCSPPKQPYAHAGPCPTKEGSPCASGSECTSGTCVFEPGCAPPKGKCTAGPIPPCAVANPYCGCALGKTYNACLPTLPFSHAGACK